MREIGKGRFGFYQPRIVNSEIKSSNTEKYDPAGVERAFSHSELETFDAAGILHKKIYYGIQRFQNPSTTIRIKFIN